MSDRDARAVAEHRSSQKDESESGSCERTHEKVSCRRRMKPPCHRLAAATKKAAPRSAGRLGKFRRRKLLIRAGAVEGARGGVLLQTVRCERADLAAASR